MPAAGGDTFTCSLPACLRKYEWSQRRRAGQWSTAPVYCERTIIRWSDIAGPDSTILSAGAQAIHVNRANLDVGSTGRSVVAD
eukprot:6173034-Pleurochrysis_carterae.AAC.2